VDGHCVGHTCEQVVAPLQQVHENKNQEGHDTFGVATARDGDRDRVVEPEEK